MVARTPLRGPELGTAAFSEGRSCCQRKAQPPPTAYRYPQPRTYLEPNWQQIAFGGPAHCEVFTPQAEGHDHEVLRGYPFASVPTWRVNFEAYHMPNAEYNKTAALLRAHGFEKLYGGPKAFSNSWHNTRSKEVLRAVPPPEWSM